MAFDLLGAWGVEVIHKHLFVLLLLRACLPHTPFIAPGYTMCKHIDTIHDHNAEASSVYNVYRNDPPAIVRLARGAFAVRRSDSSGSLDG